MTVLSKVTVYFTCYNSHYILKTQIHMTTTYTAAIINLQKSKSKKYHIQVMLF